MWSREAKPEGEEAKPAEGEAPKEGEEKKPEEKKEPEKKYEWVDVVKKKKRTKKTDLTVTATGRPGLSDAALQKLKDQEFAIQAEMREIIETDERRNDLESYIFNMRDKAPPVEAGVVLVRTIRYWAVAELNTTAQVTTHWHV